MPLGNSSLGPEAQRVGQCLTDALSRPRWPPAIGAHIMSSAKRAVLVGLGITALVAGLAPILTVQLKYKGKDWGQIQDELTASPFFSGAWRGRKKQQTNADDD